MKSMKSMLLGLGAALLLSGCVSYETNNTGKALDSSLKGVVLAPMVEVDTKRVEGHGSVSCLFGFIVWGDSNQAKGIEFFPSSGLSSMVSFSFGCDDIARNSAAYDACLKSDADLLVAPRYYLEKRNYLVYQEAKCKVTAFPGTIKKVTVVGTQ